MTSEPFHSHFFVKWLGQNEFVYGKVSSIDFAALGAPTPKVLTYVPAGTATAVVNGNTVTMTVPFANGVGSYRAGDRGSTLRHAGEPGGTCSRDATVNDWDDQGWRAFLYSWNAGGASTFPDGWCASLHRSISRIPIDSYFEQRQYIVCLAFAAGGGSVCARQVLAKDLYTPVWDDVRRHFEGAETFRCRNRRAPFLERLTDIRRDLGHQPSVHR